MFVAIKSECGQGNSIANRFFYESSLDAAATSLNLTYATDTDTFYLPYQFSLYNDDASFSLKINFFIICIIVSLLIAMKRLDSVARPV